MIKSKVILPEGFKNILLATFRNIKFYFASFNYGSHIKYILSYLSEKLTASSPPLRMGSPTAGGKR